MTENNQTIITTKTQGWSDVVLVVNGKTYTSGDSIPEELRAKVIDYLIDKLGELTDHYKEMSYGADL